MAERHLPRHPVYIISKGRSDCCLTAKFMMKDRVPFHLVVEPQEEQAYRESFGEHVVVLPFSNLGLGSIPARNWCWEHAKAGGAERHWIFDDNIHRIRRMFRGQRVPCAAGPALAASEKFVDRYENVGIAGLNYTMFAHSGSSELPPFYLNVHVYSCLLIQNDLPQRWRGRYNEDTDLCLQVLSSGLCTVLFNAFLIDKVSTMTMRGGNMTELYKGDGRLKMARSLERQWPYVVATKRRFQRPQHVVRGAWRGFDTQLKRKSAEPASAPGIDEMGMKLRQVKSEVRSPAIKKLLENS